MFVTTYIAPKEVASALETLVEAFPQEARACWPLLKPSGDALRVSAGGRLGQTVLPKLCQREGEQRVWVWGTDGLGRQSSEVFGCIGHHPQRAASLLGAAASRGRHGFRDPMLKEEEEEDEEEEEEEASLT